MVAFATNLFTVFVRGFKMREVKVKVLFYVLFKGGPKGNTWDIVEETIVVPIGTPRNRVIQEASAWLDLRLEKEWKDGLIPNVEHQSPIFAVYDIYECHEGF